MNTYAIIDFGTYSSQLTEEEFLSKIIECLGKNSKFTAKKASKKYSMSESLPKEYEKMGITFSKKLDHFDSSDVLWKNGCERPKQKPSSCVFEISLSSDNERTDLPSEVSKE